MNLISTYSMAPNGIFWTLQGEGHLRGSQMVFVRLAGCSVGCSGCDTNYSVGEKLPLDDLLARVRGVTPTSVRDKWAWITGGEPTDHDLRPLLSGLKKLGFSTAVATSGVRRITLKVDWLSVSPHSPKPNDFQQRCGDEIKLAEGLNGLDLEVWYSEFPDERTDFSHRYIQPLWVGDASSGHEDPESMRRCLDFLRRHPSWALSRQDHKTWGVP